MILLSITSLVDALMIKIIEKLDDSLGQIVHALGQNGLLDNSIIVFFSDNGAPTKGIYENRGSNFPFRGIKMSLFDGGVRVPAVAYSSSFERKGRIFRNLFHITDWGPTLFSAAGGKLEDAQLDGIDQWDDLVQGAKEWRRKEVLLNIDEAAGYSGLLYGRYKLINGTHPEDIVNEYSGDLDPDSHPKYNVTKVLLSPTNEALSNLGVKQSTNELLDLRCLATKHNCRPKFEAPGCRGVCLFDLVQDPCESKDISQQKPDVTKTLLQRLKGFDEHRVAQQNGPFNAAADPAHCHGYWYNWRDADGCWFKNAI